MITGTTNTEHKCKDLKDFLELNTGINFKELIKERKYEKLVKQIRRCHNTLIQFDYDYRIIFSDILYLLTQFNLELANTFLDNLSVNTIGTAPMIKHLKINNFTVEKGELFVFEECDIKELDVRYEKQLGFNLLCNYCDINTLNIFGDVPSNIDLESAFKYSNIDTINYM